MSTAKPQFDSLLQSNIKNALKKVKEHRIAPMLPWLVPSPRYFANIAR